MKAKETVMRSFLPRAVLTSLLLALAAPAALACLNDREVEKSEREFKSQYQYKSRNEYRPESESPSQDRIGPLAASGIGTVLLLGACALGLRKPDAA